MNYSNITTCDIVNGNGIGVVLWCQGCDMACPGCHNPETWDFTCGKPFDDYARSLIYAELDKPFISRFTLSGGHPLAPQNIKACTDLCRDIKRLYPSIKIWAYTGYIYEDISDYEILNYIDVLIDGPFVLEKRDITLPFRGSTNQRIIDINASKKCKRVVLYHE